MGKVELKAWQGIYAVVKAFPQVFQDDYSNTISNITKELIYSTSGNYEKVIFSNKSTIYQKISCYWMIKYKTRPTISQLTTHLV